MTEGMLQYFSIKKLLAEIRGVDLCGEVGEQMLLLHGHITYLYQSLAHCRQISAVKMRLLALVIELPSL